MQIDIKQSAIKSAVNELVEYHLFEQFEPAVLKAAGVGKKADIIKMVLEDQKYMAGVAKYLADYINDRDVIYDAFIDTNCSTLDNLQVTCEEVQDEVYEKERAARQVRELKNMIEQIEKAGFKVTKV